MFEFLGALVVKALEKMMGEAIDLGKQSILDRRKLFRKFFDLYEAVTELERESKIAYAEFSGYASGTEVLTRTVPAMKLERLNQALEKFEVCASRVASIVDLYEGKLLVSLNDVAAMKGMNLRHLHLVLPEAVAYDLFVPTRHPTRLAHLSMSTKDYDAKKYLQSDQARGQFGVVRIDLRNREQIREALGNSEAVIERISVAKEQLGTFIRANFPLDKVIV